MDGACRVFGGNLECKTFDIINAQPKGDDMLRHEKRTVPRTHAQQISCSYSQTHIPNGYRSPPRTIGEVQKAKKTINTILTVEACASAIARMTWGLMDILLSIQPASHVGLCTCATPGTAEDLTTSATL